jgi:uncharacterized membrane protein
VSDSDDQEGRLGIGRVEAFSDGVIAIIVTIMVLELKAPEEPGLQYLWRLWPIFSAYVLSFAYVGVYWANHHRLFGHARRVTNGLIWLNLLLLFALSLIPFSTAYLGNMHFSRDATLVYLASMLLPSIAYVPLQSIIAKTGAHSDNALIYYRQMRRKGLAAMLVYIAGVPLSFVSPWLGIGCALLVAILWFLPKSSIDMLFGR